MSSENNKMKSTNTKVKKVSKKENSKKSTKDVEIPQEINLNSCQQIEVQVVELLNDPVNKIQELEKLDDPVNENQELDKTIEPVIEIQVEEVKKSKKLAPKKEKKEKKEKKPRAKTAYNFFVSDKMKELMKLDEWKDKKNSELMKECGRMWKEITDSELEPYSKLAKEAKETLLKSSS